VQETVGAYAQLLQSLERDCAEIIDATAGARAVMQTARATQDALYDAASKVTTANCVYEMCYFPCLHAVVRKLSWQQQQECRRNVTHDVCVSALNVSCCVDVLQVRLEHAGWAKAPSDAKDLLKKMPALF
jgi:hypothetical protein